MTSETPNWDEMSLEQKLNDLNHRLRKIELRELEASVSVKKGKK